MVALAASLAVGASLVVVPAGGAMAATATIVAPLASKTYSLSSYYGPRCMPIAGASASHLGQDMGSTSGTPIRALAAGTVSRAGAISGFGQWVVIDHTIGGKKVSSVYGHVIDGDKYVKVGQKVTVGQRIADVGTSGTSTSPHLHLEIWNGGYGTGIATDPLLYLKAKGVDLSATSTRNYARVVPSSCTYYTTVNVNLRSGPSTAYASLRVVPQNATLTAKPGASSGSWRQVTYSGRTGWMLATYVSPTKTYVPPKSLGTRYATVSDLNLRSAASVTSTILAKLTKWTAVSMIAQPANGWVKVIVGGKTGYISTAYLTATKPAPPVAPAKISYVTVTTLNLRASASTSSTVLAKLTKGTAVTHAGTAANGWLKVTVAGKTGYVSTAYLSTTRP